MYIATTVVLVGLWETTLLRCTAPDTLEAHRALREEGLAGYKASRTAQMAVRLGESNAVAAGGASSGAQRDLPKLDKASLSSAAGEEKITLPSKHSQFTGKAFHRHPFHQMSSQLSSAIRPHQGGVGGATGTASESHVTADGAVGVAASAGRGGSAFDGIKTDRCAALLGGATSLPADTLEGPRAPWPYLDRKSIDIKAHAPGKPYILESLHFRPYLIEAPEFVDERDKRWFFSNGLTRRWLEESERCPTSIEGCGEAKRSGGRLLMRWEDLDGMNIVACGGRFSFPFDCGSGHRGTIIGDLMRSASNDGNFDAEKALIVIPPEQNHFQHFVNIFLNKLGQAMPFLQDPEVVVYTSPGGTNIIREVWDALGIPATRIREYMGQTIHAKEIINTCVSPQWHRGPWQTIVKALTKKAPVIPPEMRKKVLIVSREGAAHGRRIVNEAEAVALVRAYCTGGVEAPGGVPAGLGPGPDFRYSNPVRELEWFKAGSMSLEQIVNTLADTAVFIGAHGGAHNNLVFAPIGGMKVMELAPFTSSGPAGIGYPSNVDALWMQASTVELKYYWMAAEPRGENIYVDLQRLDVMLKKMFAAP